MKLTLLACMMAVTVVTAIPPRQVGGPNCVYPSQDEERCNANAIISAARAAEIRAEVTGHFDDLVTNVYNGDIDAIMASKMSDCKFDLGNDIQVMGWDNVRAFQLGFVGTGGKVLTYSNLEFLIPSENRVIMVSGDFSLSDGMSGKFGVHDFYRQDDGKWKLLYAKVN